MTIMKDFEIDIKRLEICLVWCINYYQNSFCLYLVNLIETSDWLYLLLSWDWYKIISVGKSSWWQLGVEAGSWEGSRRFSLASGHNKTPSISKLSTSCPTQALPGSHWSSAAQQTENWALIGRLLLSSARFCCWSI